MLTMDGKRNQLPWSMISKSLHKLETIMRYRALLGLALMVLLLWPAGVAAQSRGWVNIDNLRIGFITAPSEPGEPVTGRQRISYFQSGLWTPLFVDITAAAQAHEKSRSSTRKARK